MAQIDLNVTFNRVIDYIIRIGMGVNEFTSNLVKNDTGPKLRFHLKDASDNPINLTGKQVKFFLKLNGAQDPSNMGHESCAIEDANNGVAVYNFITGDLAAVGTYFGDVQLIEGGVVETCPKFCRLIVRDNNQ